MIRIKTLRHIYSYREPKSGQDEDSTQILLIHEEGSGLRMSKNDEK